MSYRNNIVNYKSKFTDITAIQFMGMNHSEIYKFINTERKHNIVLLMAGKGILKIVLDNYPIQLLTNDYLIKNANLEFYTLNSEEFPRCYFVNE